LSVAALASEVPVPTAQPSVALNMKTSVRFWPIATPGGVTTLHATPFHLRMVGEVELLVAFPTAHASVLVVMNNPFKLMREGRVS
jgi:hypothetical protein